MYQLRPRTMPFSAVYVLISVDLQASLPHQCFSCPLPCFSCLPSCNGGWEMLSLNERQPTKTWASACFCWLGSSPAEVTPKLIRFCSDRGDSLFGDRALSSLSLFYCSNSRNQLHRAPPSCTDLLLAREGVPRVTKA